MKSDVFLVKATPTARDKKGLEACLKDAIDASLAKHKGHSVAGLNVSADLVSGFSRAVVTIIYAEAGK